MAESRDLITEIGRVFYGLGLLAGIFGSAWVGCVLLVGISRWGYKPLRPTALAIKDEAEINSMFDPPGNDHPDLVVDPSDHPLTNMHYSMLLEHLFNHHFEVWNHYGERGMGPNRWRRVHEADHGKGEYPR